MFKESKKKIRIRKKSGQRKINEIDFNWDEILIVESDELLSTQSYKGSFTYEVYQILDF